MAKRQRDATAPRNSESPQAELEREQKRLKSEALIDQKTREWIRWDLARALQWNRLTQSQIDAAQTEEERRQLAIQHEIQWEWYWDWNETNTRQWAADDFKRRWSLTNEQIYRRLLENNNEPWMSINAFNGQGEKLVHPNSGDMRVDLLYNHTIPWAGYLIETWWPRYGNNRDYFGTVRVDSFALRISHLLPNPVIATQRVTTQAEETVDKIVSGAEKVVAGTGDVISTVYTDTKSGLSQVGSSLPYIAGISVSGIALLIIVQAMNK